MIPMRAMSDVFLNISYWYIKFGDIQKQEFLLTNTILYSKHNNKLLYKYTLNIQGHPESFQPFNINKNKTASFDQYTC